MFKISNSYACSKNSISEKLKYLASTTALAVVAGSLSSLNPLTSHQALANNGNVCNGSSGDVVCLNSGQENFNDTGQVNSLIVNPNVALTNVGNNSIITLDSGGSTVGSINISTGASVTHMGFGQAFDINLPVAQFTNDGRISITNLGNGAIDLNTSLVNGNSSITNNGVIESTNGFNSAQVIFLGPQGGSTATLKNSAGATISMENTRGNVVTLGGSFGSESVLINEGTISGGRHSIFADVGNETVINSGLIRASERNSFFGNVSLSSGNDIFEVRAGSQVLVGTGTDKGVVNGGDDTDTLRFGGATTQSFNLDEIGTNYINFENFEVTGSQVNFSGTTTEDFIVDPDATNRNVLRFRGLRAVLGGPVQRVIPTAILGGNGTFGELTVNSGGGLSPGNSIGKVTVNGDLTFTPGSTLIIEVSQTGADQVVVAKGGDVRIFGGTLELRDLAPALQDASQTFVIIDNQGKDQVQTVMGGGPVGFDEVVDDLAFLTPAVTLTGGDGNDVEVSFTADGGNNETGDRTFSSFSTNTPNQGNVGRALDGLDDTPGSEGKQLRDSLLVLSEDQARQTFTDLSGEIHSSGTQNFFDVGNQVGDAIGGRFSNLGSFGGGGTFALSQSFSVGAAWPGTVPAKQRADAVDASEFIEEEQKHSVWGSLTGHYSELDGNGNGTGVRSDGFGFVGGVDQKINADTTIGISGGYASSNTNSASGNSELDIDSLTVALYGLHELGALSLSGFAAYTYHDVDGTRRIPVLGLTANSDYSADQFTLQAEAAYRIENAFEDADAIPFINGRFVSVDSDAFTETGAGAANLISSGSSSDAFDLTGGMRFEAVTTTGKAFVGAGYQYRFGDVVTDTTFTFAGGGTFTAQGIERDRGSAYVEAGLEADIKDNLSFFANGTANFGGDFEAYSGSVGVKLAF